MNYEQITGILKIVVPFVCAWLAAKGLSGLGDVSVVGGVTTAVVAVGAVVWSYFAHTDAAKLQSAAAIDPGVKIMVPLKVIGADDRVATLVADRNVPNITKL